MQDQDARDAARELYKDYGHAVYRYARFVLGSDADAEDLVQDVFVRVIGAYSRFRGDAGRETWLYAIVRHALQDAQRRRARDGRLVASLRPDNGLLGQGAPDPSDPEALLRGLSVAERQVVVLRIIEDRSTRDTAAILGWSSVRVRVALHRALGRLRRHLQDHECESGAEGGVRP